VADGSAGQFDVKQWHHLKLRFVGSTITGFVDGVSVLSVTNQLFARGMVGLITGDRKSRNTACFDNLTVNAPGADTPAPTPLANLPPIY
jgi:hypothetical protein